MPTDTLVRKVRQLEANLHTQVFERHEEIRGSILALLSKRHVFMIGEPGIAKSYLVQKMVDNIDGLGGDDYFHWLMTAHTVPEEIFGPPSIHELREDRFVRNVEHKLPVAKVAFLDEMMRASSSILNSLLTIMEERKFFNNGEAHVVPLDCVFAAANDMPESGLAALWDRLTLRYQVTGITDSDNFMSMLKLDNLPPLDPAVTYAEIQEAQKEVARVTVPDVVVEQMYALRQRLFEEAVEPSDRRFRNSLPVLRASAWLRGDDTVSMRDFRVLRHIMWTDPDQFSVVSNCVFDLSSPIEREAFTLLENVSQIENELGDAMKTMDDSMQLSKKGIELFGHLERARDELKELKERADEEYDILGTINDKITSIGRRIKDDIIGA